MQLSPKNRTCNSEHVEGDQMIDTIMGITGYLENFTGVCPYKDDSL